MRRVVFAINITTDGYCNHTDMIADDAVHEYFTRLLRNADLLIFGRNTYQLMVPYWPEVAKNQSENEATNEFARVFDSLDKIVFSTTLEQVAGNNTKIMHANLAEEVLALKQQPGKDICIGSLSIASQLSEGYTFCQACISDTRCMALWKDRGHRPTPHRRRQTALHLQLS